MAATGKMYRVKPFSDCQDDFVTKVDMYKVKGFDSDVNGMLSGSGGEVEDRLRQLQQRQQRVLTELQQLQNSVQELAQHRGLALTLSTTSATIPHNGVSACTTSSVSHSSAQVRGRGGLQDLVISADPFCAPLSLLILLRQLSSHYSVLTSTFVHSSAVDTPPQLRSFLHSNSLSAPRSSYQLAITLVWKKLPHGPRLMVSPTQQTGIQGEANIARYLSRLMRPSYEEAGNKVATQIDEMLDLAQQQLIEGTNKERSAVLRTLNAALGKSRWLVGGEMSLADIVMWSALQETKGAPEAPANVKKWLQSCAQCSDFEEAVSFLSS